MTRPRWLALLALSAGLFACRDTRRVPEDATLLYDVDFSSPGQVVGQVVKVMDAGTENPFPSKLPSGLFFGAPTVVPSSCGLEKQAALLRAANGGSQGIEGLEFLLDEHHAVYHVEMDVCVQSMGPPTLPTQTLQFVIFLDIAEAHAIGFTSAGEIGVIDPALSPTPILEPKVVGLYRVGKPVHLVADVNYDSKSWQVTIDGKTVYTGELERSIPRGVRALVRGGPTTVAAMDNVLIWAQHDVLNEAPPALPGAEGEQAPDAGEQRPPAEQSPAPQGQEPPAGGEKQP